ncbi:MAG: dTMP kinase [Nanoarchaeota archaeon]
MKKRGFFIVLDGIDGSGKSTQIKLIAKYFREGGKQVTVTHEPWKGKYGRLIDRLVNSEEGKKLTANDWLELFTKDRLEHVEKEIIPSLNRGKVILSDRYYYSTLGYQLKKEEWNAYTISINMRPDLAIIIDVPVSVGMKRIEQDISKKIRVGSKTVFEKKKILEKVSKKFRLIPKYIRDNVKVVDGEGTPAEVFARIEKELRRLTDK